MSRPRIVLALVGLMAGLSAAWIMLDNHVRAASLADVALVLAVGWSFLASGLVAWRLRPDNAIGPAMVATGLLRISEAASWSQDPVLFAWGHLFATAYLVGIVFVLLAFPSGHLETPALRAMFAAAIVAAGPLHVAFQITGGELHSGSCPDCPPSLLAILPAPDLAAGLGIVHTAIGAVVAAASIAALLMRWRNASAPLRFAIAPVLWAGAATSTVLAIRLVSFLAGDPLGEVPAVTLDLMLALVAVAFLVGVARTRLDRSAVTDLLAGLSGAPAPGELRAALARVLRDPSLEIVYWLPAGERYVDAEGRPSDMPRADAARSVTLIERDGRRIAALIHDRAVADDESLVQAVAAAAGLQFENERLHAELRARLDEVQASRARIVEATQQERRRIERDLHDGTQQQLVSVAMTLGLANAKARSDPDASRRLIEEAKYGLSRALSDLRELSQGIHPGILTERGLGDAVDELAHRMRLPVVVDVQLCERLPAAVETAAYYVISEALTNVVKHASASRVYVRISRSDGRVAIAVTDDGRGGADADAGSGLRGLRDRVEALGGRFDLESPAGAGTVLTAEVPCA